MVDNSGRRGGTWRRVKLYLPPIEYDAMGADLTVSRLITSSNTIFNQMHPTRHPTMVYISSDPMNAAEHIYTYDSGYNPDVSHKTRRTSNILLGLDDDINEVVRVKERALLELENRSAPKFLQQSLLQRHKDLSDGIVRVETLSRRQSWKAASSQAVRDTLPIELQHRVAAFEERMHSMLAADDCSGSEREEAKVDHNPGGDQTFGSGNLLTVVGIRSRKGALARTAARIESIGELERRHALLVEQCEDTLKAEAKAKGGGRRRSR